MTYSSCPIRILRFHCNQREVHRGHARDLHANNKNFKPFCILANYKSGCNSFAPAQREIGSLCSYFFGTNVVKKWLDISTATNGIVKFKKS
jgi:hypothetical protein